MYLTDVVPVDMGTSGTPFAVTNPMARPRTTRPAASAAPTPSSMRKAVVPLTPGSALRGGGGNLGGGAGGSGVFFGDGAAAGHSEEDGGGGSSSGAGGSGSASRGTRGGPSATPAHVARSAAMAAYLPRSADRTRNRALGHRVAQGLERAANSAALAAMKETDARAWVLPVVVAVSPAGALGIAIPDVPGLEDVFDAITANRAAAPLTGGGAGRPRRADSNTIVTDWRPPANALEAAIAAAAAAAGLTSVTTDAEGNVVPSRSYAASGPGAIPAPVDPLVKHRLRVEFANSIVEPPTLLFGLAQVALGFGRVALSDIWGAPSFAALVLFIAAAYNSPRGKVAYLVISVALVALNVAELVQTNQADADMVVAGVSLPQQAAQTIANSYPLFIPPAAINLCIAQIAMSVVCTGLATVYSLLAEVVRAVAKPELWADARVVIDITTSSHTAAPTRAARADADRRRRLAALGAVFTSDAALPIEAQPVTTVTTIERKHIVGGPRVVCGTLSVAGLIGITPSEVERRRVGDWIRAPQQQARQPAAVGAAPGGAAGPVSAVAGGPGGEGGGSTSRPISTTAAALLAATAAGGEVATSTSPWTAGGSASGRFPQPQQTPFVPPEAGLSGSDRSVNSVGSSGGSGLRGILINGGFSPPRQGDALASSLTMPASSPSSAAAAASSKALKEQRKGFYQMQASMQGASSLNLLGGGGGGGGGGGRTGSGGTTPTGSSAVLSGRGSRAPSTSIAPLQQHNLQQQQPQSFGDGAGERDSFSGGGGGNGSVVLPNTRSSMKQSSSGGRAEGARSSSVASSGAESNVAALYSGLNGSSHDGVVGDGEYPGGNSGGIRGPRGNSAVGTPIIALHSAASVTGDRVDLFSSGVRGGGGGHVGVGRLHLHTAGLSGSASGPGSVVGGDDSGGLTGAGGGFTDRSIAESTSSSLTGGGTASSIVSGLSAGGGRGPVPPAGRRKGPPGVPALPPAMRPPPAASPSLSMGAGGTGSASAPSSAVGVGKYMVPPFAAGPPPPHLPSFNVGPGGKDSGRPGSGGGSASTSSSVVGGKGGRDLDLRSTPLTEMLLSPKAAEDSDGMA